MTTLEGKTAIVAAGAKNLGGLISTSLAQRGVNVVVHYNSDATAPEADKTVDIVRSTGAKAIKVQGDLTVPANITALFDAAIAEFGSVDFAINTVGKVLRKPITETTEAEYDSMFAINSKAAYFFIQEAAKRLNDGGSITTIVTSLLAAYTDGYSTYAGAKAPVEHFVRAASKELFARGINVNNIAPGPMDTPFFYPQETPERAAFHASQAMGNRLTDITDIAP
ncbi:SDR family oxidoreductase, partial [Mycolicibacterium palauense]|uniref:SDR family oxidoreductase n=1 Tax=Mycolicibacterium palauense TaxID=2034511 RepID=UPI000BFEE94E